MSGTAPLDASTLLPHFDVRLTPPDITPWLPGNTGIPGFTTIESSRPGPHVAIIALSHGNELAGAIVLDAMLRQPPRLTAGRLTLGFANIDAFMRFNRKQPTASRFADEDFNRLWDRQVLDGPRQSSELTRARQIRPLIDQVDILLDLHSMLWPSEPLILSGPSAKGRDLALAIGTPDLVIADHGHVSGPRLIDYAPFTGGGHAAAALVEAGQHWESSTVEITHACVDGLLRSTGLVPGATPPPPARLAEVTIAITATTAAFAFVQPFRGGDVIAERNTLIALDGAAEIRTPHDDCLLVMPSLRPSRGHTAVRLARFI
jgi:predicted deacylase